MINLSKRIPEIKHEKLDTAYLQWTLQTNPHTEEEDWVYAKILSAGIKVTNGHIIDIACGSGNFTEKLAMHYADSTITGVDIHLPSIDAARERHKKYYPRMSFEHGDVYALSTAYKNIDAITSIDSLHHFDNLDEAIIQIAKSLKPNGVFFFEDLNREHIEKCVKKELLHEIIELRRRFSDAKALKHLLKKYPLETHRQYILTTSSFMAAYTPTEISATCTYLGLKHRVEQHGWRYFGFAWKEQ